MKMIEISYTHDGITTRNFINVETIQSITDGDSPDDYLSIICYPGHKMFFDTRTPEELVKIIQGE